MIKKIIPVIIIAAVLVGFYFLTSKKPASISSTEIPTSDYILFYGSSCPHCKVVEKFISDNQIDQKININQLEVYENQSNKTIFSNLVQQICPDQMNSEGLAVPFLIDQKNRTCAIGDSPINTYLTEKSK